MRAPCFGFFFTMMLMACGPGSRDPGSLVDAAGADARPAECVPVPEICGDGIDNDCDRRIDCADSNCSGVGSCPVCGAVENPEGQPLALPDGISSGSACSTNAQCGAGTPNCV